MVSVQDFADYVLPSLIPVFMTATGQALFQLIRSTEILYQVMQPQSVVDVLIPLLARAADIGMPEIELSKHCQSEAPIWDSSHARAAAYLLFA